MNPPDQASSGETKPDGVSASWCSIAGELLNQHGVIWLKEPAHADRSHLLARLRNGDYEKPFVVDDGITRRLHFDFRYAQSEMCMEKPYQLMSAYARKMMAFLLFVSKPRDMIIVGLGGGGLTKFSYRQLPTTRVTTLEVNADVIALGDLFGVPLHDARMAVVHADATQYFATSDALADVILLDGYDKTGIAPAFKNTGFYENLRARLRPHGVLVLNLIGKGDEVATHLSLIAEVFSNRVLVMDVRFSANRVALAFNDSAFSPDWEKIKFHADQLELEHGLDFPRFAHLLQRNHKRQKSGGHW